MGRSLIRKIASILLPPALVACAPIGKPAIHIAERSLDYIGCESAQSEMWNSLHAAVETNLNPPTAEDVRAALLNVGEKRGLSGKAWDEYVESFVENYRRTIDGIRRSFAPADVGTWKKALAQLEIGIQTTDTHKKLNAEIKQSLARLEAAEKSLNSSCAAPEEPRETPPPAGVVTVWDQFKSQPYPELEGIFKTIATAYQSCEVIDAPPMNKNTASVQGIKIVGDHPAGGKRREIASLAQVNATHYYIANRKLAKNSCFEVRKSPLIYDFGGKPYTTASSPSELNMFKNGGSGTSVLGIDCSAFVFSSLALAGLKMDPDPKKILKADLVHGIGSSAYKEPQSNGLRCLDKLVFSQSKPQIEPGDIIAINGHVNIVDSVGPDPFGLARAKSLSDCTSSVLTYTGFDFVIAQSSPSKGGVGINRYLAKDYLAESSTYRTGLTNYAVAACKARFGGSGVPNSPSLSVVRHRRTPECRANALVATNFDCVDSCRPL